MEVALPYVNGPIGGFELMRQVMAILRSCFPALVLMLLLCSVFPVEQLGWAVDSAYGATGDAGHEQTGASRDAGSATESEGDSSQETPDDYVASGVSVPDCGSSRLHASMTKIPSPALLASQLLHPPTPLN